jgi:hypothetical protein
LSLACTTIAQEKPAANSNSTYQQLRRIGLSGEAVSVSDFILRRDAGVFTFKTGTFYFTAPVEGKITGAVFLGQGEFALNPPLSYERVSLSRITKEPTMTERFETVVLRFTDDTAAEIKAAGKPGTSSGNPASALNDSLEASRHKLHHNLDARILQDVLSPSPGGLFVAFIHGQKYNSKLLYQIDPHGAGFVAPEEISLLTYDDNNSGIWAAFHYTREYQSRTARGTEENAAIDVQHQALDTRIERNGNLHGKAATTFAAQSDGVRVVPFELFGKLRVQQVTDELGQPLHFIQEDKNDDPDFWVILPKALARGEKYTIKTMYDGKEAVLDEGNGNYDLVARASWYPAGRFGDYADYDMTFAVPKQMRMVATGTQVKQYIEGSENITVWKSDAPQAVAGFNFGMFKLQEAKVDKWNYAVESYANEMLPSDFDAIKDQVSGMNTVGMMKKPLAEAQIALDLYTQYFGPMAYKRVAMTQQGPCNFGQSWPELVYLPICSFFDDTVKHQLLGTIDMRGYWRVVAPHEIAHQWWGHTVGWGSYRDQWMSEGFADFSASLFIQSVWKDPKQFTNFWKEERELITEKNRFGFRPVDVGPVIMGYRLGNSKVGQEIPRRLIYTKGAFILHMIRMMMWDKQKGDAAFQQFMMDFVKTYTNKAASTEDFKAVLEKHMTPVLDQEGNGSMDWFFNEYVYGTALPSYNLTSSFIPNADGFLMKVKLTQSEVNDRFVMPVPVYVELADGRVASLGRITMRGNNSVEQEVPLKGLKTAPKRAMINYYADVLATE